jgi:hypothetical protein
MLPKGTLGEAMRKHLKVYRGPTHPHQSQIAATEKAIAAREATPVDLAARPQQRPLGFKPAGAPPAPRLTRAERQAAAPEPLLEDATPTPAEAAAMPTVTPDAEAETVRVDNPPAEGTIPAGAETPRGRRGARVKADATGEPEAPAPRPRARRTPAAEVEAPAAPRARRPRKTADAGEAPAPARRPRAKAAESGDAPPAEKPARRRTTREKE